MNNQPDTWKRSKSEIVADARVFQVRKDYCQREPDGKEGTFFVCENPDWVNIIALTKSGYIILIEQFRHGIEEIILEIPGGMVDKDEHHSVSAARELLEETGYAPREMIPLGKSRPNPAIQNNWIYHYLALDCEQKEETSFDEDESINIKLVPFEEFPKLIAEGLITHSLVITALAMFNLSEHKTAGERKEDFQED